MVNDYEVTELILKYQCLSQAARQTCEGIGQCASHVIIVDTKTGVELQNLGFGYFSGGLDYGQLVLLHYFTFSEAAGKAIRCINYGEGS